ncbi:MAG: iron-containing alcohol dehydrogenase [Deltaproteobacteria bacterium]|nr:iron-containing alcohol dehydrogenase [Deltaproteobacteria bacterium]
MYKPESYEFFCPIKFSSGSRALENIPFELEALSARKPLIITDKNVTRRGLVRKMITAFKDSGVTIGIFDGIPDVPDMQLVTELSNIYRNGEHDAIIALGCGSIVDVAKVVNIAVSYNVKILRDLAGDNLMAHPLGPFVLVPTLTGTGYETSKFTFIEDLTFSSYFLMPDLVVIDSRTVRSESLQTTVATAMVALAHAAEAYTGPGKNPITDAYAYAAIQYVKDNLITVLTKPRNKEGRLALVNAAGMAGCAFSNMKPGLIHILGEAISAMFHIASGICMGILLPYGLEYTIQKNGYHTYDLLLPLSGFDEYAGTAENLKAEKAVNIMYEMQQDLYKVTGKKIPRTLEEANVPKYMVNDIAEKVFKDGAREFGIDDYRMVLEHAWEGKPMAHS